MRDRMRKKVEESIALSLKRVAALTQILRYLFLRQLRRACEG